MSLTLTLLESVAGHCALTPTTAIVSIAGRSVDQDVDDQGHKEEHVDEASLKPVRRCFIKSLWQMDEGKSPQDKANDNFRFNWDGKHVRIFETLRAVSTVASSCV